MSKLFSPWPCYSEEEAFAVKKVILSNKVNYWTGNETREFEEAFAKWLGVKYAVALANGTLALEGALRAIGVGDGDEVIVTPRTFIASASSIVNCGATPIFADVDLNSGNITAETISKVLSEKTKAVICVHLAGWPCDMDPIMELASAHGFKVIEDCAQAHGGKYKGRLLGSIGHIAAWSFCQDKIMTTAGEGGMVTTNNENLWNFIWSYKDHGKGYDAVYEKHHAAGFRWLHASIGSNWRMMEVQAVIGKIQLAKLSEWTQIRNRNAGKILDQCKKHKAFRVPVFHCSEKCLNDFDCGTSCVHAYYKCYVYINKAYLNPGWSRARVIEEITLAGVPCFYGSCSEVYLEKAFLDRELQPKSRLKNARELGETSVMFLVHPTLSDAEIDELCSRIGSVMSQASAD